MRELLGLRLVAVLGTVGSGGVPHLTPVWFADGDDAVLVATAAASQKVANLELDARAAIVLHDSRSGFDVCGTSIAGRAEIVRGAEATPLVDVVHARYVDATAALVPEVSEFLASDDVALRLVPERAWTWDQRGTTADRSLRAVGGALPLAPTTPRPSVEP